MNTIRKYPAPWLWLVLTLLSILSTAAPARAASLIYDAEIEHIIHKIATPLFVAADLDPSAVQVYIVNDPSLNAFVAGGQKIFLHTGLLTQMQSASEIAGVIAHEIGHIAGGHLARRHDALRKASAQAILAMVLGAAAVVAGSADAGVAIIHGGSSIAQRSFLNYSRHQEAAADHTAFRLLEKTGQSARGMVRLFAFLGDQEALYTANQDPYVRTHPMSGERIQSVEAHLSGSKFADAEDPPDRKRDFARLRAKLLAFLSQPSDTLRHYPKSDRSDAARYARSIAYFRENRLEGSLVELQPLLIAEPENPYLHELKGQILFESGQVTDSLPAYGEAVRLLPHSAYMLTGLAQSQLAADDQQLVAAALDNLTRATRLAPGLPVAWRWLAVAYARRNDIGNASLATAERYLLASQARNAVVQAERAGRLLKNGTPGWLRAQDIIALGRRRLRKK